MGFRSGWNNFLPLIYTVAFLDLLSAGMVVSLLQTYLRQQVRLSATMSGLIGSAYGLTQFLSGPIIGGECDVRGYGPVMSVSLMLCGPAYILLCTKWWPLILVSRIASGLFKHTQNLSKSAIGAYLPHASQLKAFGRINAMGNVGFIVGPFLSGHLASWFGCEAVFTTSAIVFVMGGMIVLTCFPRMGQLYSSPRRQGSSSNVAGDASPNLDEVDKKRPNSLWSDAKEIDWSIHWDLFLTRFIFSFAVLVYRSNLDWTLGDRFQIDQKMIGYVTSYQGLISFISSYYAKSCASLFPSVVRCYTWFTLVFILSLIGLVFTSNEANFRLFLLFLGLLCVSTSIMRAISYDLTSERCPRSEMGLLMGVSASVVSVARALSPALGGVLHDVHFNIPAFVAIISISFGLFITYCVSEVNQTKFQLKDKSL